MCFSHFNFTKPGGNIFGRYSPATGARYYLTDHLGSTRAVTDQNNTILATFDYYPFGLLMPKRYTTNSSTVEKFTGKELDSSLGLYYFGMRYLDPALGRWLSVDPYALEYPSISPYAYAANNPLKFIDPNGGFLNPIYDEKGNFLGTDDRGLQGEAIVMNKDNFKQGMSHEAALEKGTLLNDLSNNFSSVAISKIESYQSGLSSRPDWDGKLTLSETNQWYRSGGGKSLYVALNKIDLSGIYSFGGSKIGQSKSFNLFLYSSSMEDAMIYGNITLKRYPNSRVRAYSDVYDFNMHSWYNPLNWPRNFEAKIGKRVAGNGTPFDINIYGSAEVKPYLHLLMLMK